jgi:hypothetical protein
MNVIVMKFSHLPMMTLDPKRSFGPSGAELRAGMVLRSMKQHDDAAAEQDHHEVARGDDADPRVRVRDQRIGHRAGIGRALGNRQELMQHRDASVHAAPRSVVIDSSHDRSTSSIRPQVVESSPSQMVRHRLLGDSHLRRHRLLRLETPVGADDPVLRLRAVAQQLGMQPREAHRPISADSGAAPSRSSPSGSPDASIFAIASAAR